MVSMAPSIRSAMLRLASSSVRERDSE